MIILSLIGLGVSMGKDKETSKDEILEAIARATIEHDWDEVERLYKKLFLYNDNL